MPASARSLSLALLVLAACASDTDDATTTAADTATTAASTGPTSTTTTEATTTAAVPDECPNRPGGDYTSCKRDGFTDNKLCGWTSNGGEASLTCLSPASGGFNVCGLRDCVDDCDCFTPPTTGTALAGCRAVFGDGGKACVLYCLNGQLCPDGMTCVANYGYCAWPN